MEHLGVRNGAERGAAILAQALLHAGRREDALRVLAAAQAVSLRSGAVREAPELWRIEATIHAAAGDREPAREAVERALTIARQSRSIAHELRALVTLAGIAPDRDTHARLAAVRASFEPGCAVADVREADALLGGPYQAPGPAVGGDGGDSDVGS
jgi:tetratricopeptide (TPR) repeat protein